MGAASWYHNTNGGTLDDLEEELRNSFCWGQPVAVGEETDWRDPERTIHATVPAPDGTVKRGIYRGLLATMIEKVS